MPEPTYQDLAALPPLPITATHVRVWSQVPFGELGYPTPDTGQVDPLAVLVARANSYLQRTTGLDVRVPQPQDIAEAIGEAVQMRTEQIAFSSQEDAVEGYAENDLISGFAAGRYNESRRSLDELRKARMVNAWPALHRLLWDLMSDARREDYNAEFDGEAAGAIAFVELPGIFDYERPYGGLR